MKSKKQQVSRSLNRSHERVPTLNSKLEKNTALLENPYIKKFNDMIEDLTVTHD